MNKPFGEWTVVLRFRSDKATILAPFKVCAADQQQATIVARIHLRCFTKE